MATISIRANTVRPFVDHWSDDTAFGAGTFSWQDPVHSWKAGPGEVMTVENKQKMVLYQSILTTLFYSRLYLHHYSYLEELCEWCFSVLKIVRCRLVKWSRAMIFACCSTTIFNPIRNLCNYCTRSTLIASKQSRWISYIKCYCIDRNVNWFIQTDYEIPNCHGNTSLLKYYWFEYSNSKERSITQPIY